MDIGTIDALDRAQNELMSEIKYNGGYFRDKERRDSVTG